MQVFSDFLSIGRALIKGGGALLLCLLVFSAPVLAAKLGSATNCETLRAQKKALEVLGVKKNMAQGPGWVKQNLADPEIYLVRSYLLIDEKVRFRCALPIKAVRKKAVRKVVKRRVRKRKNKKKR